METPEELREYLEAVTQHGVWGQLLDRGTAWSIMRRAGVLPQGAPPFGLTIETDLAEHGFAVLRAALALRESGDFSEPTRLGFERAANAFEALVRNDAPDAVERGFFRTLAGAAYHLAGYSAIAYSLFNDRPESLNTTAAEDALVLLILRDLDGLQRHTRAWLAAEENSDPALAAGLDAGDFGTDEVVASVLNTTVCRALAYFDFALQTGDEGAVEEARTLLDNAVRLAANAGAVSPWWISRVCRSLIEDLWSHSLHVCLPHEPPTGGEQDYADLRRTFLATLYGRRVAEVELWPSQREAAKRSTDFTDDLVVALPTSAGKTRVAEIAALMTLATGRRVLIVTPLRALSAQTERSFRKTFAPLGFSVSSLYGASGVSPDDEDALATCDIVIATPEKLDFALRTAPGLIDDVGLLVLDEGHLIGPSEREIRFEILVQRLLRRNDSATRRIVCLSAILPAGEQLDDLTAWIRHDAEGTPVKSDWRPTRQRYGTIVWQKSAARLNYELDDQGPFLARFVEQVEPKGRQRLPLPRETKDLTLFAAWAFAVRGKRALVFSTQANWVEGYGRLVLDLCERGYLQSLLEDPARIERALEIGREWLGADHPAVQCLKVGVAIHYGRLPNPFLRELESLGSSDESVGSRTGFGVSA